MNEVMEHAEDVRLERLPPIADPVVRSALAQLSIREFRQEFAIPTPVDDKGFVDHEALLYQVSSFVEPNYKWRAPFFDEHHLYWQASYYDSSFIQNPQLAKKFRNLPINKIWIPRELHDFIHLMTFPSDVPRFTAMRGKVHDFRRRNYLYTITSEIMSLKEVTARMTPRYLVNAKGDEEVLYIDPQTKRVTRDLPGFEERRQTFMNHVKWNHDQGYIDLSRITPLILDEESNLEEVMPIIHAHILPSITRGVGHSALRVDVPFERVAA